MRICAACRHRQEAGLLRCGACGRALEVRNGIEIHAPEVGAEEGFDPAHFRELARLEADHFWFRQRNRIILDFVQRFFPGTRDYMEVGCGTGYVLQGLSAAHPQWRAWGSELHVEGLAFAARRLPGTCFLQMDARRIPFAGEFDLIGSYDVLEHIHEDDAVLASIRSALKPGGGLLVTVPQHPALWSSQDEAAHHVRRYRIGELEGKLQRAGFDILRSTSFVSLLLPAMLASRLLNRMSAAARNDPLREVRIGSLANRIGALAMGADRSLIRAGLNLPIGGSRIIAARSIA
jgi:SAM-dependent methyltransferase